MYLGPLELIAKFDPFLAQHIQKYGAWCWNRDILCFEDHF